MAEETTTEAVETPPATETSAAPETPAAPSPVSVPKGWRDLAPEDVRGHKVFDTVTDLEGNLSLERLLKLTGNQALLLGRQGKGVQVPGKDSTPTEREMFFEAIGRPKSPEDYQFEPPKDLADYYDKPIVAEAMSAMHKAGFTQEQVATVMALDAARLQRSLEEAGKSDEAALAEATEALHREWGAKFDANLHVANRVIAENVAEAERESFLAEYGNDPKVIRLLATVGAKFMEASPATGDAGGKGAMTPGEAQGKMQELIAERGQMQQHLNPAKYERLSREITRLAELAVAGRTAQ